MPSVKLYNSKGSEVGTVELSESVFGCEYNEALIHQAVVAQLANARQGTKSTLTRSEVRGGGRKPWRQKGTGRARHGSIRSPQWIKGGVAFAPKPRDFSKKMNIKARRAALYSALSYKVQNGEFIVVDALEAANAKTREVAGALKALGLDRSTLLVTEYDENVIRAARNIPTVTLSSAELLSVYEVVRNQKLLVTKAALESIEEVAKR